MQYIEKIKNILVKIPFIFNILVYFVNIRNTGTIYVKSLTPEKKAELILEYANKYNCKIFVETGTYKGDTLYKCKDFFNKLYSIELSQDLFYLCKNRFVDFNNIYIFKGDSSRILPKIVEGEIEPIIFWLDAHYSGGETARGEQDSPIIKELSIIFSKLSNFCILIDDARYFNGKNGYPKIGFLKKIIYNGNKNNRLKVRVKNDIIRITNA